MSIKLETLETLEIIKLYSEILIELKERKVIRSKNLVGELGEFLVLEVFNSNIELPNLKLAPPTEKLSHSTSPPDQPTFQNSSEFWSPRQLVRRSAISLARKWLQDEANS